MTVRETLGVAVLLAVTAGGCGGSPGLPELPSDGTATLREAVDQTVTAVRNSDVETLIRLQNDPGNPAAAPADPADREAAAKWFAARFRQELTGPYTVEFAREGEITVTGAIACLSYGPGELRLALPFAGVGEHPDDALPPRWRLDLFGWPPPEDQQQRNPAATEDGGFCATGRIPHPSRADRPPRRPDHSAQAGSPAQARG
ncbi:hypothetical protein [Actinocorallia lasiicapitis]